MKTAMFIVTYVTLAILANGCGLQKADDAKTIVFPNIPSSCYLAGVEQDNRIYKCGSCVIKATDSGHILDSSC